jgi:hypothetical protein
VNSTAMRMSLLLAAAFTVASCASGHYPIMLGEKKWIAVPLQKEPSDARRSIETVMLIPPRAQAIGTQTDAMAVAALYATKYAHGCTFSRLVPGMGWVVEFVCLPAKPTEHSN